MKLVALDFETANACYASACSLGITVYEDGEILNNFEWMIRPHQRYFYFTNTGIHGIDKDDVIDEKEFYEYYEQLHKILEGAIIVAHNAPFDIGVLNAVCDTYGLDHFENEYIDTVRVSRKVYPELYNHKLNTVCEYLNIDLNHHNACSDSMACLLVLIYAMAKKEIEDIYEFMRYINVCIKKNQ